MDKAEFSKHLAKRHGRNRYLKLLVTKADGTDREMIATLNPTFLQERFGKFDSDVADSINQDPNTPMLRVFDVANDGWRTINTNKAIIMSYEDMEQKNEQYR